MRDRRFTMTKVTEILNSMETKVEFLQTLHPFRPNCFWCQHLNELKFKIGMARRYAERNTEGIQEGDVPKMQEEANHKLGQ